MQQREKYRAALAFCRANKCGAKKALNGGNGLETHLCSATTLTRLRDIGATKVPEDTRRLLTYDEEALLANWILQCAEENYACGRVHISDKIMGEWHCPCMWCALATLTFVELLQKTTRPTQALNTKSSRAVLSMRWRRGQWTETSGEILVLGTKGTGVIFMVNVN